MIRIKLVTPTRELVEVFNSFWTSVPVTTVVKLFEDDDDIDISKYIEQFKKYDGEDKKIVEEEELQEFLEKINSVYHTRVSGIDLIVKKLKEQGIDNKDNFTKRIKDGELTLPKFVAFCKEATGKYPYSFASKVFSFIAEEKYPIIDSFVATLLNAYEYDRKKAKSTWGDYSQYIDNYIEFMRHFGIEGLSFKKVDKFLWTYAKILSDYWSDMGVLSYEPVAFDTKSLNGIDL